MSIDRKHRSYNYGCKNQIFYWHGSDSEDLYKKNLKNNYNQLKKYGWIYNNFTYKFNSYGFRCEEFSDDPTIMALGCSNTLGTGLPVDKIWPELLAKELNMKCANLGVGGGSLDSAFRMCHGYIDTIKPKIVVLLSPPGPRVELFTDDGVQNMGTWSLEHESILEKRSFFYTWVSEQNNVYFNEEKNILAIKQLCEQKNIKFINKTSNELIFIGQSLARDLIHAGIENHKLFAKKLLSKI